MFVCILSTRQINLFQQFKILVSINSVFLFIQSIMVLSTIFPCNLTNFLLLLNLKVHHLHHKTPSGPDQSNSHDIYIRYILTLSSYVCLSLLSGLIPWASSTRVLYTFCVFIMHAAYPDHFILFHLLTIMILCEDY